MKPEEECKKITELIVLKGWFANERIDEIISNYNLMFDGPMLNWLQEKKYLTSEQIQEIQDSLVLAAEGKTIHFDSPPSSPGKSTIPTMNIETPPETSQNDTENKTTWNFESQTAQQDTINLPPNNENQKTVAISTGEIPNVLGSYKILEKVGQGGMGKVFKARHTFLEKLVAFKILNENFIQNTQFVARFFREAQAAGTLDHPNIIRCLDAGVIDGIHYLAMDFVDGETITSIMTRKKFEVDEVLEIALRVLEALEHAAIHNMIHRDLKPENIMISNKGEVKLLDLGLAKVTGDASLTLEGSVLGTPYYMSPEQCQGDTNPTFASDIYSLGATLYHMLTGEVPYNGESPLAIINQHIQSPIPKLSEKIPKIDKRLDILIERMMFKDPSQRYQHPTEVKKAIIAILNPVFEDESAQEISEKKKSLPSMDTSIIPKRKGNEAISSLNPDVFPGPKKNESPFLENASTSPQLNTEKEATSLKPPPQKSKPAPKSTFEESQKTLEIDSSSLSDLRAEALKLSAASKSQSLRPDPPRFMGGNQYQTKREGNNPIQNEDEILKKLQENVFTSPPISSFGPHERHPNPPGVGGPPPGRPPAQGMGAPSTGLPNYPGAEQNSFVQPFPTSGKDPKVDGLVKGNQFYNNEWDNSSSPNMGKGPSPFKNKKRRFSFKTILFLILFFGGGGFIWLNYQAPIKNFIFNIPTHFENAILYLKSKIDPDGKYNIEVVDPNDDTKGLSEEKARKKEIEKLLKLQRKHPNRQHEIYTSYKKILSKHEGTPEAAKLEKEEWHRFLNNYQKTAEQKLRINDELDLKTKHTFQFDKSIRRWEQYINNFLPFENQIQSAKERKRHFEELKTKAKENLYNLNLKGFEPLWKAKDDFELTWMKSRGKSSAYKVFDTNLSIQTSTKDKGLELLNKKNDLENYILQFQANIQKRGFEVVFHHQPQETPNTKSFSTKIKKLSVEKWYYFRLHIEGRKLKWYIFEKQNEGIAQYLLIASGEKNYRSTNSGRGKFGFRFKNESICNFKSVRLLKLK